MAPRNKTVIDGTSASSVPTAAPVASYLERLVDDAADIRGAAETVSRRLWTLVRAVNENDIPPKADEDSADVGSASLLPRLDDCLSEIEDLLGSISEALSLLERNLADTGN